jgi:hypothetical protein
MQCVIDGRSKMGSLISHPGGFPKAARRCGNWEQRFPSILVAPCVLHITDDQTQEEWQSVKIFYYSLVGAVAAFAIEYQYCAIKGGGNIKVQSTGAQ